MLAGLGLLALAAVSPAAQLLGTLVTVNNTTSNSTAVAIGTISVPPQVLAVQTGGLTATNALTITAQVSMDGTNYTSIGTFRMSTTNATTQTWNTGYSNQTLYFRISATTTNNVEVGVTLQ